MWPSPTSVEKSANCRYIGDGHPTFNRNPYNGYIGAPTIGLMTIQNNGSLDPGTCDSVSCLLVSCFLFSVVVALVVMVAWFGLLWSKSVPRWVQVSSHMINTHDYLQLSKLLFIWSAQCAALRKFFFSKPV